MAGSQSINPSLQFNRLEQVGEATEKPSSCTRPLTCALGVILILGGLAAAGVLYSYLGYTAYIIGGGSATAGILACVASFYCTSSDKANDEEGENRPKRVQPKSQELPKTDEKKPLGAKPTAETPPKPKTQTLDNTGLNPDKPSAQPLTLPEPKPAPEVKSPPKVVEPETPFLPLPRIGDLKIADNCSLQIILGKLSFIRPSMAFVYAAGGTLGANVLKDIPDEHLDHQVLNLNINYFLFPDSPVITIDEWDQKKIEGTSQNAKKAINWRLNELDKYCQLKERMRQLKYPYIPVATLLPYWDQSFLPFHLMLDEEFCDLTVDKISSLPHESLADSLGRRIQKLKNTQPFQKPEEMTKETIGKTLLCNLWQFTADEINSSPQSFPAIVFVLIPSDELKKIDTSALSREQLELIFSKSYTTRYFETKYFVEELTPRQVNDSIHLIENKALLSHLSEDQVLKFDYTKADKEIVAALFKDRAKTIIPKLGLETIYKICHLFSPEHWGALDEKLVLAFDLSRFQGEERQNTFNALFSTESYPDRAAVYLPKLSLAKIYELAPLFSKAHWQRIGDEHSVNYDLSQEEEAKREEVFNNIFGVSGYSNGARHLFPLLPLTKIYALQVFFKPEHWKVIGQKHATQLDFSLIPELKRQEVFNAVFFVSTSSYNNASNYLPKLRLDQIYAWQCFFSDEHWKLIGKEHSIAFDFDKIEDLAERKRIFNVIFSLDKKDYRHAAKYLAECKPAQINKAIPLMEPGHLAFIGETNSLQFDLNQIPLERRQEVFNTLYSLEGNNFSKAATLLPKLPFKVFVTFIPYFSDEHWTYIGKDHSLALDIATVPEEKRAKVVSTIFSTESNKYSKAAKLFPELLLSKIYTLIPYFSSDDEHWKYLGDAHIKDFDYSKLDAHTQTKVFRIFYSTTSGKYSAAGKKLPALDLDALYKLTQYFKLEHWALIGEKHTLNFDYNKIPDNEKEAVVNLLFSTKNDKYSPAAKLLPQLTSTQIKIIEPYLSEAAKKYIKR